jgi:hypothetical protein
VNHDLDTRARVDTVGVDDDLGIDRVVEQMVRGRLSALADHAVVPSDAWEKLQVRTAAEGTRRGGVLRGRRRLVAAAAVLLALVGSTVADSTDGDKDRVRTDDTPTTTVDTDDIDPDDRDPRDRDEDVTVVPDRDGRGAPDPHDESAAPPSSGTGSAGGDGAPGGDAPPAPSHSPGSTTPQAPTTTAPAPTTTTPSPPPRQPGDITVTTSSGFDVELILDDARPGWLSAFLRRTDSAYDGPPDPGMPSDGYSFSAGVVAFGPAPVEHGERCVRWAVSPGYALEDHVFAFGKVGADIAAVRVLMESGEWVSALVTTRTVANGMRGFMIEVPTADVAGVEAYDAAGGVVVTAMWPDTLLCGEPGEAPSG